MRDHRVAVADMRAIDEFGVGVLIRRVIEKVRRATACCMSASTSIFWIRLWRRASAPRCRAALPIARRISSWKLLHDSGLVRSVDIVELNPFLDERGRTARVAVELIGSLFGLQITDRPTPAPMQCISRQHLKALALIVPANRDPKSGLLIFTEDDLTDRISEGPRRTRSPRSTRELLFEFHSAASFTSGAAARTSASTWASNLAKFFWNMPTSARAVLSNSALSAQVLTGSRNVARRRAARSAPRSRNICRCGNRHCAASRSAPRSRAPASRLDRHAAAGAVFAAGPAGVDQPAIDIVLGDQVAQQVAVDRRIARQERRAEAGGEFRLRLVARGRARCPPPSRYSRTGSDTSPAPASSCDRRQHAERVRGQHHQFFGWPARRWRSSTFGMNSIGYGRSACFPSCRSSSRSGARPVRRPKRSRLF